MLLTLNACLFPAPLSPHSPICSQILREPHSTVCGHSFWCVPGKEGEGRGGEGRGSMLGTKRVGVEDANCIFVLCSGQCIATALQRSNLCPLCKASLKPNKATIPNHFCTLVHTRTHRQTDTDHTHTLPVNPTQCSILHMLTFSEPACTEVRQAPGEGPSSECPSMRATHHRRHHEALVESAKAQ